jgi:hypothetical protein
MNTRRGWEYVTVTSRGLSDTALQDVTDAELAMKLLKIRRGTVARGGLAPIGEQLLELCQAGQELLHDATHRKRCWR